MVEDTRLTVLLDGLYGNSTSAQRRNEIQAELEAIRKEAGHKWQDWVLSSNDYVKFFALTILTDVITKGKWMEQPAQQRSNVKQYLFCTLKERYPTVESFVARKMVAVLVAIAKLEWPAEWPDFLPTVHTCFETVQTMALGITILLQVSEEFVAASDLPSKRRESLKGDLLKVAPDIMEQLIMTLSQVKAGLQEQANPLLHCIAMASIGCLGSYLSWVPRDRILSSNMNLPPVLEGCLATGEVDLRAETLGVVYELCSTPYISPEPNSLALFDGCVQLLQNQLQSYSGAPVTVRSSAAYAQKLAVCTVALLNSHVNRLHADGAGKLLPLMQAVLQFSLSQDDLENFEEAVGIWSPFISWLEEQKSNCTTRRYAGAADTGFVTLQMYAPVSISLLTNLLDHVMLSTVGPADNLKDARRELDIIPLDPNTREPEEGTLARHLNAVLPVVGRLASIYSDVVLLGSQSDGTLGLLGQRFAAVLAGCGSENAHQEWWLQDVQTVLGIYCHVSYEAEHQFQVLFPMTCNLLSAVLRFGAHLLTEGAWRRGTSHLNCTIQCLHLLQAYSHWLAKFQELSEDPNNGLDRAAYVNFIEQVLQLSLLPMELHCNCPVDGAILLAAHQLFAEICAFAHPDILLQLRPFLSVVVPAENNSLYLHTLYSRHSEIPEAMWKELFRAVAFVLLGPLPPDEAKRMAREELLRGFLDGLRQPVDSFLSSLQSIGVGMGQFITDQSSLPLATLEALRQYYSCPQRLAVVDHALGVVEGFLSTVSCSCPAARMLLHQSLQSFYPMLAELLNHILLLRLHTVLPSLFPVFVGMFKTLKKQIGPEYLQSVLAMLLSFTLERQVDLESVAFEQLLHLLEVLVNNTHGNVLVEHVTRIVVEQIAPMISEKTKSDVSQAFYLLVHSLMQRNWPYFWQFTQAPEVHRPTGALPQAQWQVLLGVVLQPLQWVDLTPFHLNCSFLQELDNAHGIFQRLFTAQENFTLTAILVQVLVQKTHQLYTELIVDVLWRICNVNPQMFYMEYLREMIQSTPLLSTSQKETIGANVSQYWMALHSPQRVDLISFTVHITDFTRDFAVFKDCNTP